jgi:predicted 3-demethylubiquinone-9 3-methyltransferase (glyoxalase superfamily)
LRRGKGRFGVSWQIVPEALGRMHAHGSSEQVGRMMAGLMIAALQAAYDEGASG